MRCQLDSSQLVTGCTWGVSVSLTHSHMLPPLSPPTSVLISQLGHVMLAFHSLCLLTLDPSVLFSLGSLPSLQPLFVKLNFSLRVAKHLSAIENEAERVR